MDYEIGRRFWFVRDNNFDPPEAVSVVALKKHGHAKLSNGWVVDEFGCAEGSARIQGGHVEPRDGDDLEAVCEQ